MKSRQFAAIYRVMAALLAFLPAARAEFVIPEYPAGAEATFAWWTTFTDPYTDFQLPAPGETVGPLPSAAEGNLPNPLDSTNFTAKLIQNGPNQGTVISGSGGIYSTSGAPMKFLLLDQPAFETDSVLLQVRTIGTMPDLDGARLYYRATEDGVLQAADEPSGSGFVQRSGSFYAMWEWDLSEETVFDLFIVFGAAERMMSLQEVQLDIIDQKTSYLGVALRIETSSLFATVGEVEHNLVGESSPRATYHPGDQVEVHAKADSFYRHEFAGWTGDLSGSQTPATLTIGEAPTVKAVFAPRDYQAWTFNQINPFRPGLPYAQKSAIDADPDGDGFINLLEYALGGLPEDPNADDIQPQMEISETGDLRFAYRRQMAATDLTYRVLVSDDLINWHHNGDGSGTLYTEELPDPAFNGDGTETVTVRPAPGVFPSSDRLFFRLEVTHSPET